jgi:phage tail-like protein
MAEKTDVNNAARFYVQIEGVNHAVFTEISGLQVETEVLEFREGGNNSFVHRLPGPIRVGNITLKHGLVGSAELFNWYMQIAGGRFTPRNMSVIVYDTEGKQTAKWDFVRAYPVRWVGPQLSGGGGDIAIETLELAHAGLQLE